MTVTQTMSINQYRTGIATTTTAVGSGNMEAKIELYEADKIKTKDFIYKN